MAQIQYIMSSIRDQSSAVQSTTDSIELDDINSSPSLDNYGREDGSSDEFSDTSSMSSSNFIQENFHPIPVIRTYWIPSFALGNPILPFVFHPLLSPLLTWQWHNGNFIGNMWYHQWFTLPLAPPFIHQAGMGHFPPVFFSPWYGPSLNLGNLGFLPSPYHVTYGQHKHGYNTFGQNSYFPSPSTYMSGDNLERFEGHYTSQFMEVEAERYHWQPMFEPFHQHIVDPHIGHQMHLVPAQATLMPPMYHVHPIAFESPAPMLLQDMHNDMRLDIDNMSYEELLALEEQIGDVSTGLREETIMELLKRRYHIRIGTFTNSDESCSICREEYVHGDEIGELNCGHEFHMGCIKQWLIVKNTCPICKMKGLDA